MNTSNSLHSSEDDCKLYIFENNEDVIKTIVKGRSPFMRYVARTQRITLDWFFDRSNFDPKIQIRYVDTKNHLADIPTKGSFSENEWINLLRLKNIMTVRTFPRSHFSHFVSDFSENSKIFAEESAVTKPKSMSSIPAKIRPIILVSEASTVQGVGVQEVTPIWSWANLKVLGGQWECRRVLPRVSDKGQRLNWTRLTMKDTPKWKYRKIFRALKLGNEIELVISSNGSFRQRTAKSVSATDVKTEFLNMEITHHQLCLERTRIIYYRGLQDQDPYLLRWRQ